jgi:membrane protein required for colicin V production
MTSLDFFVFGLVALSTVIGLMRGLVREAFSLGAWVLAFIGAKVLAPVLAPFLPGIDAPALRHAAALVLVFVSILIAAGLAGVMLSGVVKLVGLGPFDRALGGVFGVLRAGVALAGLTLLAGLTALPKTQVWQHSVTRGPLVLVASRIKLWLPKDLAALIRF